MNRLYSIAAMPIDTSQETTLGTTCDSHYDWLLVWSLT